MKFKIREATEQDGPQIREIWKSGIFEDERSHFYPILMKQLPGNILPII